MNIGYARVSTQDQNLNLQKQALQKAGCKKIFEDQISGSRGDRPGLARALEILRAGDTLVVWKLDRLGRSVKHLVDLVAELQEQNIQFKSLTDNIDTSTTSGRFFFHVMASLAQMERELTLERTQAGLAAARQLGRIGGRKRQMTDSKIASAKKLLATGASPREVAKDLGVSVPTLYRWVPVSVFKVDFSKDLDLTAGRRTQIFHTPLQTCSHWTAVGGRFPKWAAVNAGWIDARSFDFQRGSVARSKAPG